MTTFDANTFGPDEVPVEYRAGFSTKVLIDLNGDRVDYILGKYDHIENDWKSVSIVECDPINMRWSFLPLAIYETNPELRKTVKL
jgi:hypothetical protein